MRHTFTPTRSLPPLADAARAGQYDVQWLVHCCDLYKLFRRQFSIRSWLTRVGC